VFELEKRSASSGKVNDLYSRRQIYANKKETSKTNKAIEDLGETDMEHVPFVHFQALLDRSWLGLSKIHDGVERVLLPCLTSDPGESCVVDGCHVPPRPVLHIRVQWDIENIFSEPNDVERGDPEPVTVGQLNARDDDIRLLFVAIARFVFLNVDCDA